MPHAIVRRLFALSILVFVPAAFAGDVKLKFNHLTLNAHLEKAPDWPGRAILMMHGELANNKMEIMDALQSALKKRGLSSLSINLGLGMNNRPSAMYDCSALHKHKHTDALDEIGAWLQWLKKQRTKDVTLLGHSRGANQIAWFAAERDDPALKRIVLIAPMTWNADRVARSYEKNAGKALAPLLDKAKASVQAGKGDAVLEHTDVLYCKDGKVSAASFVSYYEPDARFDTPALLPKISKPTLVFAGSSDEIVPDVAHKVGPLADGKKIQLKVIEGADHFFRDLYAEDVADAVAKFFTE